MAGELSPEARDARHAAEAVARRSYGRLIAFLAARTRDVAGAEDALSEAFASALASWPVSGVPRTPEAWLLTAARRKLIDAARQRRTQDGTAEQLLHLAELDGFGSVDDDTRHAIPDDRLTLMFTCAHPAIDPAARAPLMLQTVLGFDAATIASAFLVAPATMGQRLVRAKAKIRDAGIPFRVPDTTVELQERLGAVLDAVYAIHAEGWVDADGTDTRRRNLAEEAIWLGSLVTALLPGEPEALGLLSLMLHTHARRDARRDDQGRYVPLAAQDTRRWDHAMLERAEALLREASASKRPGRYQLEAAIQSAHAVRRRSGRADTAAIVALYDALWQLTGSPVVALNRAVALADTEGPQAALVLLDDPSLAARLAAYQPYWAARARLLSRAGEAAAADAAYQRAMGLEPDAAVRDFLQAERKRVKP
ncbi:MAG: RNA polymerase subunit sigma-70 [Rhizobacter sp.]|nr:RNA polymerase subunit sigma-70 [Rhizobacter sp.]